MNRAGYSLAYAAFLRALGVVYVAAFLPLARDASALLGPRGLLPVTAFLEEQRGTFGAAAPLHFPSLFWLSASDGALAAAAWAGVLGGVLLALGVTSRAVLLAAWVLYASFVVTGQAFVAYRGDLLLVEAGFLASVALPSRGRSGAPAVFFVFLFRWLTFRLLFGAAIARLSSDPCWRSLTCLPSLLETGRGPTSLAFVLHALPAPLQRFFSFVALAAELVVPFASFGPRRVRTGAALVTAAVSIASMLCANTGFERLLVVALCLFCLDDETLGHVRALRWLPRAEITESVAPKASRFDVATIIGAVLFGVSLLLLPRMLSPAPGEATSLDPLHLVNAYGVIEPVEHERTEVVFEGTNDDVATGPAHWLEYELPCKPGDPSRAPCWPTPYLHRLDARLWEASLGDFRREAWVVRVVDDLLRGNRTVTRLFSRDPFAGKPPRFVRIERYHYRFAAAGEPRYWHREPIDDFVRPFSVEDPALYEFLSMRGWLR